MNTMNSSAILKSLLVLYFLICIHLIVGFRWNRVLQTSVVLNFCDTWIPV